MSMTKTYLGTVGRGLAHSAGVLALTLAAFALAPQSFAQDAAPAAPAAGTEAPAAAPAAPAAPAVEVTPETVVATIGEDKITEADLAFAAEDLSQELGQMAPTERRAFLLRVLIDMKVMAKAARDEKMDETPIFQQRLAYLEERALRRAYFAEAIAGAVTPESIKTAYDAFVAAFVPQEEVHASHILVETEDEAKAVEAELAGGAVFADVAKAKSIDPGAANGGDLGFFSKGMMVGPFETAAFALTEPGQVSAPVQSQFGWHVIKLDERRESSVPPMEQVTQQLQQQVLMTKFNEVVARLMGDVTVDIPDAALAAAVNSQTDPAEGEAAPTEGAAPAPAAQ